MKKMLDLEDAPLYVRWIPENIPISLELRLEIVALIQKQIDEAESSGMEIGGVLIGQPASGTPAVLRIDDVLMITRKPEDGPIFMLDPREHDRFLTMRWDANTRARSAVGFFRTHLRAGPMRLSLADRTLITGHFAKEAVAILLIEGKAPRRAALFVGAASRLPDAPSVPEFIFDEGEFRGLPEAEDGTERTKAQRDWTWLIWTACAVVLLAVAGALYLNWDDLSNGFGASSQGPTLRATGGSVVTVSWNHGAPQVRSATAAKLTIDDGELHRVVPIGTDELRLGTVEYDPQTSSVAITLTLSMPDATTVSQSVTWHGS